MIPFCSCVGLQTAAAGGVATIFRQEHHNGTELAQDAGRKGSDVSLAEG